MRLGRIRRAAVSGRGAVRLLALAAVVAVGVSVAGPAVQASAEPAPSASSWWFDQYGVADAHADGWTGAGVKIAVIDAQINPSLPVFDGADLTVDQKALCKGESPQSTQPTEGAVHGSDVTALLLGNGTGTGQVRGIVPQASVRFYGDGNATTEKGCHIADRPDDGLFTQTGAGIARAVADGAQVISISLGGDLFSKADAEVIADAIARGVVIVAASANAVGEGVSYGYPAQANGVVSVNAIDAAGNLQQDHYDPAKRLVWPEITVVAPGVGFPSVGWDQPGMITGSSLAAPLVAGIVAATMQKYPHATGNQVIQSLIHNTFAQDHPLERDKTGGFGYGVASLRHMLAVDPTQYPDENPLMDKASGDPTVQMVAQAKKAIGHAATPPPEGAGAAAAGAGVGGLLLGVAVAAGAVGLLVVIAVVVIVLVVLRRGRRQERSVP